MAKNYFFCAVSGKKGYQRNENKRTFFLDSCKSDMVYYLEKGQPMGAFKKVKPGDIVFLTFQQKLVACGEVDIDKSPIQNDKIAEYVSDAIPVKGWDSWLEEKRIDMSGEIKKNTVDGTKDNDKVKEISKSDYAENLIDQLRQKSI